MKKLHGLFLIGVMVIFISVCSNGVVADNQSRGDSVGNLFDWPPGLFYATDSPTDLAIDGSGFFILRDSSEVEEQYFTRSGAFHFDSSGDLVSSQGHVVQGWALERNPETGEIEKIGSITDIKIYPLLTSSAPTSTAEYAFYESSISIDDTGVINAMDTEDHIIPLFRIALAKIFDTHRLSNLGDDLFQTTEASGEAITSKPGSNGLGSLEAYALEELASAPSYETDISVNGNGLFFLRSPNSNDQFYYASTDSFRFNKEAYLVTSNDYVVQGWQLETNPITGVIELFGSITDIRMQNFSAPPDETDLISIITNIDAGSINHSPGINALSLAWDGNTALDSHIPRSAYEHEVTLSVYDFLGSTHDITIYFDKADTDHAYEFILTYNPAEDKRAIFDDPAGDAGLGLLGRGTIFFSADGILTDINFERYVGNGGGLVNNQGTWPSAVPTSGAYSGTAVGGNYTFTGTVGTIGTDAITVTVGGSGSGTFIIHSDYEAGDYIEGPDGMLFQFNVGSAVATGNAFNVNIPAGASDNLLDPNNWANMDGDFSNQHFSFSSNFMPSDFGRHGLIELDLGARYNGSDWVAGTDSQRALISPVQPF